MYNYVINTLNQGIFYNELRSITTKIQHELIHTFVMEATPLCLFLNKPHVFSLTQHRFIVIQFVTLTCKLRVSAILKGS